MRDMGEMYVERAVKNILQREMYGIKHGLQIVLTPWWWCW